MNQFDIIFQEKIHYQKDGPQYTGYLAKSKYADESDKFHLDLYENKTTRNLFISFDLIEYEKVEEYIERKKDNRWKLPGLEKPFFYFQLIPKHQQQKQIFGCETELNRIKWIKILNEYIKKLNTHQSYELNSDGIKNSLLLIALLLLLIEAFYSDYFLNVKTLLNLDEDKDTVEEKPKPAVPPRSFNLNDIKKKLPGINSLPSQPTTLTNQLNNVLLKSKKASLKEDEIFYRGTMDQLKQILVNINKSGTYAVAQKVRPESDCIWAIRVYENTHSPLLSWNIYQNAKTNEFYLSENDSKFSNILDLCLYYTNHDLPSPSTTINRLILPYKHYLN